jgi:uncharacterized protein
MASVSRTEVITSGTLGLVIDRHLLEAAQTSLRGFRVTVINGPRQSGKTTLARTLVSGAGSYWSLDDETVRAAVSADPAGFIDHGARPMVIDEVQRGGDALVLAVKSAVDRQSDRGQFVLAGSTRFLSVPQLSESLAGRAEFLDLWPLSQGELVGVRESFVDALFHDLDRLIGRRWERIGRAALFSRIVAGGFPEVVGADADLARRWYRNYVRTVIERDVVEASAISQAAELPVLLRLIAANTSGELVAARLAGDARLTPDSTARYVGLLELVGLIVRIPAWTPSLTSREKRHSKAVVTDSGLACSLLGRNALGLESATNPLSGPILESFVTMEVIKQLGWAQVPATVRHWRDRNGAEVDLVLEEPGGDVAAIEVKASSSVVAGDARHLASLRDRLGVRFASGCVLYLGDRVVPLGDRLWALPVPMLWAD